MTGTPPSGERPSPAGPLEGEESTTPGRQRVVRARGGRRAKLTPAPGSDPSPESPVEREQSRPAGPDDERITRERPPHW
ncbi:hypothetical protein GCM10009857_00050 [Agromyces soli]